MHTLTINVHASLPLNFIYFFYSFVMPLGKKAYLNEGSAVLKRCNACRQVKHISAFTKTVLNYCHSICNSCSSDSKILKKCGL